MASPTVVLIGAGALGRHHLTGLYRMSASCRITVVDPSEEALKSAKEIPVGTDYVTFVTEMPQINVVDLAIIATTSGHRAAAVAALLEKAGTVRHLILEKILFDKKEQYQEAGELLKAKKIRAWVNHPRRLYPFHQSLKDKIRAPFAAHVRAGARFGLMTSVLHYADYFTYLAGSDTFTTDTSLLRSGAIESKRKGYLELFGTLIFTFENGSWGAVTTLPQEGPLRVSIASRGLRAEMLESDGTALLNEGKRNEWQKLDAPLLRQSDLTGAVAERILKEGTCDLP
ncbi:MAG TPA: Gfo/Idh/MocA family oxidoreductase, partial [Candidatus Paceibacterota bacterium]